jgi:hypothetical protein
LVGQFFAIGIENIIPDRNAEQQVAAKHIPGFGLVLRQAFDKPGWRAAETLP